MTFDDPQDWLAAFRTAPQERLTALLAGRDRVAPYFRTDGAELLGLLLPRAGAPDPHGDHPRLDAALTAWFAARLAAPLPEPARWNGAASQAARAIDLVTALPLPATAAWLQDRWGEATAWAQAHSRPTSEDLRAALWRALARHQPDHRLAPRWRELAAQVGRGAMPEPYLDIALLGLMALPQPADAPRPSDDVLAGLAIWARRLPNNAIGRAAFQREWRALATLYPRGPEHWQTRLPPRLAAEPCRHLAAWWAAEIGLVEAAPAPDTPAPAPHRPPTTSPKEAHALADRLRAAAPAEAARLFERFVTEFEAHADAALDAYNLTRSFNIVGNRLLATHPAWALRLARTALARDRHHQHSWLLWSRALRALGHRDLAETVLWEANRVVPENGVPARALAALLAETGRPAEAEALYRQTMRRFPDDAVAPNALAHLLAAAGRPAEAEALYRQTMRRLPDDAVAPNALAHLLAAAGRPAEAEALYRQTMRRLPDNAVCRLDLGLLLLDLARPEEVPPILAELQALKDSEGRALSAYRSGAPVLAAHLAAVRAGRPRPHRAAPPAAAPAPLPPDARGESWAELRTLAAATRAGFLLSRALDAPALLLVTAEDRTRLRAEARATIARLSETHANHPLVRLLAWRHSNPAAPRPALPAAAESDIALRLAIAVEAGDPAPFPALLRDPRFDELRPVTALAWLLVEDPAATPAAQTLLNWLPHPPDQTAEPVLRDLHARLTAMLKHISLTGMTPDQFLDAWSEIFPGVAAVLRDVFDLALLALVEREPPLAALAWEPAATT